MVKAKELKIWGCNLNKSKCLIVTLNSKVLACSFVAIQAKIVPSNPSISETFNFLAIPWNYSLLCGLDFLEEV